MYSRIFGVIVLAAVLAVLFVLTEETGTQNTAPMQQMAPSSSDADFKGLKIN